MSINECNEPDCQEHPTDAVDIIIEERPKDLGGFMVGRILPYVRRRMLGPFLFFDHMGQPNAATPTTIDVRPHPHINLATVTYLFEGEIQHRDSLGSDQAIRPGAINWMTAGRGIVHSERTPAHLRAGGDKPHGIQLWVALPKEHEEVEPAFDHYAKEVIPAFEQDGVRLRMLAGSAYGVSSPVKTFSPLFYLEAFLPAGARLPLPKEHEERGIYVVTGEVSAGGSRERAGRMMIFHPKVDVTVRAETDAHIMLLGGANIGPRHLFWNFASSSVERLEQAKEDWREGRFPKVPGDDKEFIPLPE